MTGTTRRIQTELNTEWWRTAAIYQIYPRSFADSDGDGIGDLPGITGRLEALRDLGVDAVWLSPFYPSPQLDAGYDVADYCDVDPVFGTLGDFDALLAHAHDLGLRVIVDLVPNHSSSHHPWFRKALDAGPGSEERGHYIFHEGKGVDGDLPPNNWESDFGGSAWTRIEDGEWYLHLFDSSQPDFDWNDRWVRDRFLEVMRFWLDRGIDGFRIDVAHGLAKAEGLPDHVGDPDDPFAPTPFWSQPEVHEIFREWRALLDRYDGERILCAEAWVDPLSALADWVRPDEMHQAFNFAYLFSTWGSKTIRSVIDDSLAAFETVGAPSTWVLSNHDVVRHATRLGFGPDAFLFYGIGPDTPGLPDPAVALRRARAATLLMLALPGSVYLYQGEELGLPQVLDIPDALRQDPIWHRTDGERYGRDGCRVPIPWEAGRPAYGFNDSGLSWLPQPGDWDDLARDRQENDPGSTLSLYRDALRLRADFDLGAGHLVWRDDVDADLLAFTNGGVQVVANLGDTPQLLPAGSQVLLRSHGTGAALAPDECVWLSA
jgi:alpha-glucosidase